MVARSVRIVQPAVSRRIVVADVASVGHLRDLVIASCVSKLKSRPTVFISRHGSRTIRALSAIAQNAVVGTYADLSIRSDVAVSRHD